MHLQDCTAAPQLFVSLSAQIPPQSVTKLELAARKLDGAPSDSSVATVVCLLTRYATLG